MEQVYHMKTIILLFTAFSFFCLKAQVTADAGSDTEICIYDTLKKWGSGLSPGDTGTYRWRNLSSGGIMSNSQLLLLKINTSTSVKFELQVQKTSNGQTYTDLDTFELKVNLLPSFVYKGIPPRCYYDGAIQLTTQRIAVGRAGYNPAITDSSLRYYQNRSQSWITGGPAGVNPYVYEFNKFITNNQLPVSGALDTICYDYKDPKGCYNKECRPVRMYGNPNVLLSNNSAYCQSSGTANLNSLVLQPFNKTGGIQSFRCIGVPAGSGVNPDSVIGYDNSYVPPRFTLKTGNKSQPDLRGNYTIEYCFKNAISGCQTCDTTTVTVKQGSPIIISELPSLCIDGSLLELDSFLRDTLSGKRVPDASWSCVEYNGSRNMNNPSVASKILGSVINKKLFDPKTGTGRYLLKVEDTNSDCMFKDSVYITTNGLPLITIEVPDTVCSSDDSLVLNNIVPAGLVGSWSGPGVSGRKFYPGISPNNTLYYNPGFIKYTYTNPLTTCTNADSQSVLIQSPPSFNAKALPVSGTYYDVEFSIMNLNYIDTTNYKCIWVFGNGDTSNYYNPGRIHFNDSGNYTALLYTGMEHCMRIDTIRFKIDGKPVSIEEIKQFIPKIYPNPLNEILNIEYPFEGEMRISDISGRMLMLRYTGSGLNTIDLSALKPGIYILNFESGSYQYFCRIIVE